MYFANIQDIAIDVDGSGNVDVLKNLTAKALVSDELTNNAAHYETVTIQDGERPDHLSKRLYNTEEYHWTFLLLNPQIKNIWDDWPMSSAQLIEYCTNKYQYLAGDTDDSLVDKFKGGPVGITTLATAVSESAETIEEVYEPFLIQQGYLQRTSRGRIATRQSYEHFGLKPPSNSVNLDLLD